MTTLSKNNTKQYKLRKSFQIHYENWIKGKQLDKEKKRGFSLFKFPFILFNEKARLDRAVQGNGRIYLGIGNAGGLL